jgi:hypothetical protein
VLFEQRQLRAGVGFLAAADDAQVNGPALQLVTVGVSAQQRGQLGDGGLGLGAWFAVDVEHAVPGRRGDAADRRAFPGAQVPADAVVHPAPRLVVPRADVVDQAV